MPKFDVVMPNPNDVNDKPRRETVEAPDEHSARIAASERYGWQVTEISEHKAAKKKASGTTSKSRKKASGRSKPKSATTDKKRSNDKKRTRTPISRKATQVQKDDQSKADKKLTADPEDGKGQLNSHTKASDGKPADPQSADNSGTQASPEFLPAAPGGSDK